MTGNKNPSSHVFWNDIENDECLKSCGYAAAGMWLRHLLPIAARSREYGVILVGNSPCLYADDLPRVLANTLPGGAELIATLLEEIVRTGTASIDDAGRLINRRMVKERELSEARSRAGHAGAEARWQTDGKHHGKADGKQSARGNSPSHGNKREIPGLTAPSGCDADGKTMPSSLLHDFYEEGDVRTEDRVTAPAGAGADEPKGSRKARAEARGTRIPDGWQPGPEAARFARDLGLDPDDVTPEFVDYWRGVAGQKGRKLDWNATYRNRCRELASRKGANGARTGTSRPQHVAQTRGARNFETRALYAAALSGAGRQGPADGGGQREAAARDLEDADDAAGEGPAR